jgi:hypothetical protein
MQRNDPTLIGTADPTTSSVISRGELRYRMQGERIWPGWIRAMIELSGTTLLTWWAVETNPTHPILAGFLSAVLVLTLVATGEHFYRRQRAIIDILAERIDNANGARDKALQALAERTVEKTRLTLGSHKRETGILNGRPSYHWRIPIYVGGPPARNLTVQLTSADPWPNEARHVWDGPYFAKHYPTGARTLTLSNKNPEWFELVSYWPSPDAPPIVAHLSGIPGAVPGPLFVDGLDTHERVGVAYFSPKGSVQWSFEYRISCDDVEQPILQTFRVTVRQFDSNGFDVLMQ